MQENGTGNVNYFLSNRGKELYGGTSLNLTTMLLLVDGLVSKPCGRKYYSNDILCYIVVYRVILCYIMLYCGVLNYCVILCYIVFYHVILMIVDRINVGIMYFLSLPVWRLTPCHQE